MPFLEEYINRKQGDAKPEALRTIAACRAELNAKKAAALAPLPPPIDKPAPREAAPPPPPVAPPYVPPPYVPPPQPAPQRHGSTGGWVAIGVIAGVTAIGGGISLGIWAAESDKTCRHNPCDAEAAIGVVGLSAAALTIAIGVPVNWYVGKPSSPARFSLLPTPTGLVGRF